MNKKTVFSGVQPSGNLTIGNYLGAIKNFSRLQDEYNSIYSIVDMHSITVPQVPSELRKRTYEVLALYLATGLDPEKSTIFVQSHVSAHAELCWVLNSISYMGQLNRMTQYKDKSSKSEENLNAALFTYPVLMAADILLYQTDFVPVGEDQRQHLELARDLAIRFNSKYSDTFKVPDNLIQKETGKIYNLKNPELKMSKSDPDANSYILMLDDKDTIVRKVKRAVTDSLANFNYSKEQKGLQNLINIYSAFSGEDVKNIVNKYRNENYSVFKEDLGILIAEALKPIQNEYDKLMSDKGYLESIMKEGAEKARYLSYKTLRKVYKKVGFVQI
ncbi:tryptophan--tRNA ligase [Miniphocaeibacter massiliensis]|uniref:tryptophan--tRNA ligase n=1 Tax=Miniphocaeibacter massiliensis TaxID=2041841 RepID=UPI000C07AFB3|nr:tryptophan--tRNA ligase [Miniphocaeibacter massiliensis]